jgi:hypothetical protein
MCRGTNESPMCICGNVYAVVGCIAMASQGPGSGSRHSEVVDQRSGSSN